MLEQSKAVCALDRRLLSSVEVHFVNPNMSVFVSAISTILTKKTFS
jgi:hypothetical protein